MSSAAQTNARLLKIRTQKDLKLRSTKHLKSTFTDYAGVERPLTIRYYQVQGILHLMVMKRFLLGDDTGLGKTLQAIAALCYTWEKEPGRKAIILTTKSATRQWAQEFARFTTGVRVIICKGTPQQRSQARRLFEQNTGDPTVMIMGYRSAVQDFTALQNWQGYVLITDEATAYKNTTTQVHQVCRHLSARADRLWALTATLIKNNLMEGYGIYEIVMPGLFQMPRSKFMLYFCLTRLQQIRGGRSVPVIVGYLPEKITEFRQIIDPYFIGRPKHEVASELPSLIMQVVEVELSKEQEDKYYEALQGMLVMGDGSNAPVKQIDKLTAVCYLQEIVNDLELVGCTGESPKLDTLIDKLTEGDLADEKVIVFSRFKRMVDIIMARLAKEKIKAVRVTGDENEDQRAKAMKAFQDPEDETRVICITTAGSEAINLQAAKALICYDTPWSAGDFLQLVGRMIRIGSEHDRCYVLHLTARCKRKTIDHRVLDVLHKKMELVEAVLGKRLKGVTDQVLVDAVNDLSDLYDSLRQDAKEAAK